MIHLLWNVVVFSWWLVFHDIVRWQVLFGGWTIKIEAFRGFVREVRRLISSHF